MTQSAKTDIPSYQDSRDWATSRWNGELYTIVILTHARSGEHQDQETFLAPSVDNQTRSYDSKASGSFNVNNNYCKFRIHGFFSF